MFDFTQRYALWLEKTAQHAQISAQLAALAHDEAAQKERFSLPLAFGTGGLRGEMGVGDGRMNVFTVAQATQGLCNHLNAQKAGATVAIAYDSRLQSAEFAQTAAGVLAANGVQVYIYSELMPTPALSYAVRALGTDMGIVITASHNPAAYNGYKIYNHSGAQITLDAANAIAAQIAKVDIFDDVCSLDFATGLQSGQIAYIDAHITADFLRIACQGAAQDCSNLQLVYTPLCGSGLYCVTTALGQIGVDNIALVKEQEQPDGNFPTCAYPNPESAAAMQLGEAQLAQTGADILLATDPDCDRVGVAVRTVQGVTRLNGNEIGLVLLQYLLETHQQAGTMPQDAVLVKTIVTTPMADLMAQAHGVAVYNVLTGFKFIGEQINWLEQAGQVGRYLFGFEESCGYLANPYVRDKDGVSACVLVCRAAAYYKAQGRTFLDVLHDLYATYGVHQSQLLNFDFPGLAGMADIAACMARFRCNPFEGATMLDYQHSAQMVGGQPLPQADVLQFTLAQGGQFIVRPSGTEPKLKIYLFAKGADAAQAQTLLAHMQQMVQATVSQ